MNKITDNKWTGPLLLLTGMALFGSATPISKLVGEHFPIFTASLLRVVLGALTLLPFVIGDLRREISRMNSTDWINVAFIAIFGMVGFTVLLIYGMQFISGVAGSIIMAFTPALTALAAYVFMRSPMDWRKTLAVGLGVAGILVVNVYRGKFGAADNGAFYLGVTLVLGAIACEAAYTLLGKRATRRLPPILASLLACVISIPLFIALAVIDIGELQLAAIPPVAWLYLGWWGVGTLGAGSAFWYSGVKRASGTTAAGFMAIMPVSALLLSYFLLGEAFRPIHLLGIALVLASVGLMSWIHASGERDDAGH